MDQRDGSLGTADHVGESEGQPDSAEEPDVPSHAPLLTQVVSYVAASLALAIALYVVLRPENYGLTPNSLDPLFYSGYAINFDDVLNAAGQRHYFVSRWTAYLPGYVSDQIAGPFLGRLLLRLVLASLVLSSLWVLGARQRWTWAQRVFIGGLVVSMPMFTRAFFTDYVEYMVVALGICLVALCLRENASVGSSALVGALAAAIVIANPIAITAVAMPLGVYILLASSGVRRRLAMSATVVVAGILLVSVGLIWFRWRYGLENVYRPSIEFARNYEGRDGFKSPRLDWLWYFTWLFATPLILVVAAGVGIRRVVRFERFEIAAFVLCGLQYAYQWIDQFVRDGNGLEVSYYWSFAYPTFAVALALLVGKITADTRSLTLYLLLAGWVVVLLIYIPTWLRLPAGLAFFVLALVVAGALIVVSTRSAIATAAGLVLVVGWTQFGAPVYDPTAYFEINVSPRYDRLYRKAGALSEVIYGEAVWFEEQMDRIPNDASTSFVPVGGWSTSIIGLYAPHPIGRVVPMEPERDRLAPTGITEIRGGFRPIVAVYGPPENVETMIATFPEDLSVGDVLLDVTDEARLGYRLVVYEMPNSAILPFTWDAASLPRASGEAVGDSVIVGVPSEPGFVTFGPYSVLEPGAYVVSLDYSSTAAPNEVAGTFEVVDTGGAPVASVELPGTDGVQTSVPLRFDVDNSRGQWEFRTVWSGIKNFKVNSISLMHDGLD